MTIEHITSNNNETNLKNSGIVETILTIFIQFLTINPLLLLFFLLFFPSSDNIIKGEEESKWYLKRSS